MNTEERIMRCEIEGSWTAKDMAESLLSFRDLYSLRLGLEVVAEDQRDLEEMFFEMRHFPPFRRRLKTRRLHPLLFESLLAGYSLSTGDPVRIANLIYPHEELKVRRIEYSSPGFKDLAGFGEIIGHIKDFSLKLIEHFSNKRSRDLKDDEQELRNQSLRIQNAREFVSLARECGFDEPQIRELVHLVDGKQEPLIRLIESGKLQRVQMLDESNSGEG